MENDELKDRVAIREVIDSYAHNADRRPFQKPGRTFYRRRKY